jgi:hypothetical protein
MTETNIKEVVSAIVLAMRLARTCNSDWSETASWVSEMCKAYAQRQETEEARGACDS